MRGLVTAKEGDGRGLFGRGVALTPVRSLLIFRVTPRPGTMQAESPERAAGSVEH